MAYAGLKRDPIEEKTYKANAFPSELAGPGLRISIVIQIFYSIFWIKSPGRSICLGFLNEV